MNKCIEIGRIATDIDIRTTQSGLSVARFKVAVNRRAKNDQGGHDADFIPVTVWRQTADFLKQYAEKLMIVDVKELGINTIDNSVVEFFNPLVINPALRMFASKLADERKHPLSVRRYMWKLKY
mgnify:CR=1 FL=1